MKLLSGSRDFARERARRRDNYTCQNCRKIWIEGTRRFDVHHLDDDMEGSRSPKWDRENLDRLITLCHKCHLNLDAVRKKMSFGHKK